MHLTEYLLEPPQQEIVANMKVHRLLVDYFEASLEACRCCETIVQAIHQTRLAYARVTNVVVKLSQTTSYDDDQSQNPIHTQLSSFVLLQNNPLSIVQFCDIYSRQIHDPLTYAIVKEKENSKNINYKACLQEGWRNWFNRFAQRSSGCSIGVCVS